MPVTEAVQVHDGFITAFDFRTRNPKWVLEHMTAESLNGSAERWVLWCLCHLLFGCSTA